MYLFHYFALPYWIIFRLLQLESGNLELKVVYVSSHGTPGTGVYGKCEPSTSHISYSRKQVTGEPHVGWPGAGAGIAPHQIGQF